MPAAYQTKDARENPATLRQAIAMAWQFRTAFLPNHPADLVAYLANGKIEAIGTHEELTATCENYRQTFGHDPHES